jgi:tetratricopeptide (TPR) repeat protein
VGAAPGGSDPGAMTPGEEAARGSASTDSRVIITGGVVQGLVIGDHNTVTQHFHQAAPPSSFVPHEAPLPTDRVIGREALLATLTASLTTGDPPRTTALHGMGGVGKSTLAALFAGSPAALEAFPHGHFWVDLRDGDALDALDRMARSCGHDVAEVRGVEARSRVVRSLLAERRVLVICDDARTEEEVLPFLQANPDSAVLITTRDEGVASALTDRLVAVDRLDTAAGVALLEALAGVPEQGERGGGDGIPVLPALVEELGGLPLALELVGKQARKEARRPGFSWAALRARYMDAASRLGLGRGERGVRTAFDQAWTESLSPEGHRHFALLGIFPGAELLTGEIAAAWNEDDDGVRGGLGELLDLSLLRQVDAVTVRLHPLVKDFAGEKAGAGDPSPESAPGSPAGILSPEERRDAHLRVADYHVGRANPAPKTWQDIQPVLASHIHACAAGDRERARRVFPWFGSVAVPGFLIDRGYLTPRIHHLGLDVELSREEGPITEAYARYWYANALGEAGRNGEAVAELEQATSLIAALPDQTVGIVPAARGKFAYRLGQILAESGDLEGARRAYGVALEDDRAMGQGANALTTLLQIGDLWLKQGDAEGEARARGVFQDAREEAREGGHREQEAMALSRLADRLKLEDPERALECVDEALRLDAPPPSPSGTSTTSAFASRQGAHYAVYLGRIAAEILRTRPLELTRGLALALHAYAIALRRAAEADAVVQQAQALHWMGHLFEHLFLVPGQEPEDLAAAACYAHATHMVETMESPPAINPRERLESRVAPRLDAAQKEALARSLEDHPLALIQEAIDRVLARIPG